MPNGKPNTTYEIELPGNSAIALGRLPMPYKEGSYDGHPYLPRCRLIKNNKFFEISYNDIREFVFDPVVNEAVKLLEKQIEKSKGFPLATVLMVGGFSQSKYLKMKIDECRKINNIPHVCESPNGVTDISRGAVSYFLEPRLVSKKVATASYAVCVESSDKKNARSHLAYFIRQSDSIEIEGEAYNKRVSVTYPGSAVIGNSLFISTTQRCHEV